MSKVLINDIKTGMYECGSIGPCFGPTFIAVSINYTKDNVTKWICCLDGDGIPTWFESDVDISQILISEDESAIAKVYNKYKVEEIDGIELSDEYHSLYSQFDKLPDDEALALKLIAYLVEFYGDYDAIVNKVKGKYLHDFVNSKIARKKYNNSHYVKVLNNYKKRNNKKCK